MRSRAKTIPTVLDGKINPSITWRKSSVVEEMYHSVEDQQNLEKYNASINVVDGHLVLSPNTELGYTIPPNTTLVEVLGPVGNNSAWLGDSVCYASFDPRPNWWNQSNFPTSTSFKPMNATDQTMFLLPLDPEVAFNLKIGSFGNTTTCPISAIRSYPFR